MGTSVQPALLNAFLLTTRDALMVLEAARRGICPVVTRRLHDSEKASIVVSGSVFAFDENATGIKRWTDGALWSPSRIVGNYLVYRELDKKRETDPEKASSNMIPSTSATSHAGPADIASTADPFGTPILASASTPTSGRLQDPSFTTATHGTGLQKDVERALVGSLTTGYSFKRNGLVKKTISNGSLHLICYYTIEDVIAGRLRTPSSLNELASLEIFPALLNPKNFRVPPLVEYDTSGTARYAGEESDPISSSAVLAPLLSQTTLAPSPGPSGPQSVSRRLSESVLSVQKQESGPVYQTPSHFGQAPRAQLYRNNSDTPDSVTRTQELPFTGLNEVGVYGCPPGHRKGSAGTGPAESYLWHDRRPSIQPVSTSDSQGPTGGLPAYSSMPSPSGSTTFHYQRPSTSSSYEERYGPSPPDTSYSRRGSESVAHSSRASYLPASSTPLFPQNWQQTRNYPPSSTVPPSHWPPETSYPAPYPSSSSYTGTGIALPPRSGPMRPSSATKEAIKPYHRHNSYSYYPEPSPMTSFQGMHTHPLSAPASYNAPANIPPYRTMPSDPEVIHHPQRGQHNPVPPTQYTGLPDTGYPSYYSHDLPEPKIEEL